MVETSTKKFTEEQKEQIRKELNEGLEKEIMCLATKDYCVGAGTPIEQMTLLSCIINTYVKKGYPREVLEYAINQGLGNERI